jgi:hypothetical protein
MKMVWDVRRLSSPFNGSSPLEVRAFDVGEERVRLGTGQPSPSVATGAMPLELNDEWAVQRRYMTLEPSKA